MKLISMSLAALVLAAALSSCDSITSPDEPVPDYISGTWGYVSRQLRTESTGRYRTDSIGGSITLGRDGKWSRHLVQPEYTVTDGGTCWVENSYLYLEQADGESVERWSLGGFSVAGYTNGVVEGMTLAGELDTGGDIYYNVERPIE